MSLNGIQGLTILAIPNGTLYLYDGHSLKPVWSFPLGSSISTMYQVVPDGDNEESSYPSDGDMTPYPFNGFVLDMGDSEQNRDSIQANLKKMVKDYIDSVPHITTDEVKVGATKIMVKVLDAKDGSVICEFDPHALPGGEKIVSTEAESVEQIYIMAKIHTLSSYDKVSQKLLWNITVSDIRADMHFQGTVTSLPVHQFRDISHVNFLYEKLMLSGHEESQKAIAPVHFSDTGTADSNSTLLALIDATEILSDKNMRFRQLDMRSFFLVVLLICGLCYLVINNWSNRKLTELRQKKAVAPKRKKARKLGNDRNITNTEKNVDIGSSEVGEHFEGPIDNARDGKESWFQLGARDQSSDRGRTVGKLFISNIEIAKGSNGTVVLEGSCDGRPVAVKRLVKAHHDVAYKEIQNLIVSDQHPNIVRWYGYEWDSDFVYLSLERCTCSLNDLVQLASGSAQPSVFTTNKSMDSLSEYNVQLVSANEILKDVDLWRANGYPSTQLVKLMREIVAGVAHLHELGIIHRDLKPHNILITKGKSLCAKLSDMGISKRLVGDQASLGHHPTGYGSSGWQAPEQLLHGRQTRAVDMFSLGCVIFFCITGGKHPFGDHLERDVNIVKNRVDLFMVDHIPEAVELLSHLLDPEPESRPTAWNVMDHPLFWSSETRLSFLRDASDRVELEDRENDSYILRALENVAPTALGGYWDTKMESEFINNIGRYRRYKFDSVRDLLRVVRNKLNHYRELPKEIQEILGPVPDGFNGYFASRFPRFLIEVYGIMNEYCKEEKWFGNYLNRNQL